MKDISRHDNEIKALSTSDLWLAATLHTLGVAIDGIDTEKPRAIFYFIMNDYTESLTRRYFSHKLQVDPLKLQETYRAINAQVHTRKG